MTSASWQSKCQSRCYMGTRQGRRYAGRGWNWERTGRGLRCGTAEQRVVQEDGAGATMSVQVKLFIALHHGPCYEVLITTSIIPLFPPNLICSSYPGKSSSTFTSGSCHISLFLGCEITFYTLYVKNSNYFCITITILLEI